MPYKQTLLNLFHQGLNRVKGDLSVQLFFQQHVKKIKKTHLIAIGKAASAMTHGAVSVFGDQIVNGLVITKKGYGNFNLPFECFESSHPIPDKLSLIAGEKLLAFIANIPKDANVLFLISGGTSALVEVLQDHITLNDLKKLNEWLLSSGLPIDQMNRIRCTYSKIKGGGLCHYLQNKNVLQLLISDVPSNNPEEIGSGLLYPDLALLNHVDLPDWVLSNIRGRQNDRVILNIDSYVVASIFDAMQAIKMAAEKMGLSVDYDETLLTGDAEKTGKNLAQTLLKNKSMLLIRGGETTIVLPKNSGVGGRNQHLALSAATVLEGHDHVCFLSAGTDGTDGPTEYAGGIVDGATLKIGKQKGLNVNQYLKNANSGTYLKTTGNLIKTGATGTNVMDIVLGLKPLIPHI